MQTDTPLLKHLKEKGWQEVHHDTEYRKGSWFVIRDTSHWWMVGTEANSRIFDVPEPTEYTAPWTVNLIEHLCKTDDKITFAKTEK